MYSYLPLSTQILPEQQSKYVKFRPRSLRVGNLRWAQGSVAANTLLHFEEVPFNLQVSMAILYPYSLISRSRQVVFRSFNVNPEP